MAILKDLAIEYVEAVALDKVGSVLNRLSEKETQKYEDACYKKIVENGYKYCILIQKDAKGKYTIEDNNGNTYKIKTKTFLSKATVELSINRKKVYTFIARKEWKKRWLETYYLIDIKNDGKLCGEAKEESLKVSA